MSTELKTTLTIPLAAVAQARYALYEKFIKAQSSLATAEEVFPAASANVVFWRGEVSRVFVALESFGGRP